MKYNIYINQKAGSELFDNLDIIDLSIYDFIKTFIPRAESINDSLGTWYWINNNKIIDDMPLLKIKTRQAVIKRINKLVDAKLLDKHPNGQSLKRAYYRLGEKYEAYEFDTTSVNEKDNECKRKFTMSVNESLQDNSISDNSIIDNKENNIKDRESKFYEELKPYVREYGSEMIRSFYDYWSEPNKSKSKMKFELKTTWDTSRRLKTWSKNNFGNKLQFGEKPVSQTPTIKLSNEEPT